MNDVFQVLLSPFLILLRKTPSRARHALTSLIHPVPVMRCAIAFERERRLRGRSGLRAAALLEAALRQDLHCAVLVAAREFDMPRLVAFENPWIRMMKTVAIAYRSARITKPT